ncbi:MAG: diguanylate cyclase [Pseudomonadota bacterium]
MTEIRIDIGVLDQAFPMHILFDTDGVIVRVGPTLQRIAAISPGMELASALRILRPSIETSHGALLRDAGRRLVVELPFEYNVPAGGGLSRLNAMAFPLGDDKAALNLSFGPAVAEAVARHKLSAQDFAPVDPTIDVLFLLEAQAIVTTELKHMAARLEEARAEAEAQAITDKLTGLGNRRAMDTHLGQLADRRGGAGFGLMHLDLDHFKAVNDTLGHAAGDHVLTEVGRILREETRRGDVVARMGGDEFMMIFYDCEEVSVLEGIATRIIRHLEEPIIFGEDICRISGSIGIVMSSGYDVLDADRMMADMDAALYAAKAAGRARFRVAEPAQTGAT